MLNFSHFANVAGSYLNASSITSVKEFFESNSPVFYPLEAVLIGTSLSSPLRIGVSEHASVN